MKEAESQFPTWLQLWQGAILVTLAHAIYVAADPELAYEVSWDGNNYSRQDSQGTRGTVTFAPEAVVAVFRDDSDARMPGHSGDPYDLNRYLNGIPEDLRSLAQEEALQYVLDDYEGNSAPIITAAFWGRLDATTAVEPWEEVVKHGAQLISVELMETNAAFAELSAYYEFSSTQSTFLRTLYANKMLKGSQEILLSKKEYTILTSNGNDGIEECRELLSAIGIRLPE